LPEESHAAAEFARMYGLPLGTALGGAETMWPEYRKKLQGVYTRPQQCKRYCCGWEIAGTQALPLGCEVTASGPRRTPVDK
jgi:hypothetical protein